MSVVHPLGNLCLSCLFTCLASPGLLRSAGLTVQFVSPSPGVSQPADLPRVRITGELPPGAELHVTGIVNHAPDHDFHENGTVNFEVLRGADLARRLIPLTNVKQQDLLQLTATLMKHDGTLLAAPARFLPANGHPSTQAAPAALQRLLASGSQALQRIANLYDSVRADVEEPRFIFLASLTGGQKPKPEKLPLDPAQYRSLALSPDGALLSWTVALPEGIELWVSTINPLQPVRIDGPARDIQTTTFADPTCLLYVKNSKLVMTQLTHASKPRTIDVPSLAIFKIYRVQRIGASLTAVVRAESQATPGIPSPFAIEISADGKAEVFPLADNWLYDSYPLFVEGRPFFFAGSENGVEGIHALQSEDASAAIPTIFEVRSPGLVTLSADGTKLTFVGSP